MGTEKQKLSKIKGYRLEVQNFRLLFWRYFAVEQAVMRVIAVNLGNKIESVRAFLR